MKHFESSALGRLMEYRSHWSDRVGFVLVAHGYDGGKFWCRDVGSPEVEYSNLYHTVEQAKQVLLDFDRADLIEVDKSK